MEYYFLDKEKKIYKKILLIDLDGVLNEYEGKFDKNFIPKIKNGAKNFLKNLSNSYNIQIFTTRNRLLVSKWLIKNNIDIFVTDVTNIKNPAYLQIDDRCICFNGNFDETIQEIKNFDVYWRK